MKALRIATLLFVACGASRPAAVEPRATAIDADIAQMTAGASSERIAKDIASLVAFRNRNTCGTSIAEARDFVRARFEALGLRVALDEFEAPCAETVRQKSVIGVLAGRDPRRLVMVGGHYDSRTTERNDGTSDAPGANDSGSQTALVLEAARLMAGHAFEASVAFVAFAGEEQGLLGSKSIASHLATLFPGAALEAMLDCDIVGGDKTANDDASLRQYRLYAPGAPRETGKDTPDGSADGTSPSRLLQRFITTTAHEYVPEMETVEKRREDRPGRGSDHQPFIDLGIPGVRFIETAETLAHQHSPDDVIAYVTPAYTARITRVVVSALASLARAPRAPEGLAVARNASRVMVAWKNVPADHFVASIRGMGSQTAHVARGFTTSFDVAVRDGPLRGSVDALAPPFFVTVSAVDAAGHASLPAPEWRCDASACAVPIGPEDVVRKM
jgi:hypothetical protein